VFDSFTPDKLKFSLTSALSALLLPTEEKKVTALGCTSTKKAIA
jgi:hypothetical protein